MTVMKKVVKLEVLANGAIYVNDTRITNRSTKPWAGSHVIFQCETPKNDVVQTLIDNGFSIRRIDTEPYLKQLLTLSRRPQ